MASWLCSNEQTQSYGAFIIGGIEWNGINVIFGSLERAVALLCICVIVIIWNVTAHLIQCVCVSAVVCMVMDYHHGL